MKLLSHDKYADISSAIEIINGATSLEQFVNNAFRAVENIIPCDIINYTEINAPANLLVWQTSIMSPDSAMIGLLSRYISEHPGVAFHFRTGRIKSLMISDFLSKRQFRSSKLYNEVYRQFGSTEYELGTPIWLDEKNINSLVLGRSLRDFSEDDRLKLDYIRPHLMQAYVKVQILEFMKRLTQNYSEDMVVVNGKGEVVVANDNIWQIIARYFNISISQKSLPEMVNKWIYHERSHCNKVSNTNHLPAPLVVSKNGQKLALHFLWGSAQYNLLFAEENSVELSSYSLNEAATLTKRENQILAYLCEGKTNAEIALSLLISHHTVKKHLDNIYRKLKVNRRSAAAVKLIHRNYMESRISNNGFRKP